MAWEGYGLYRIGLGEEGLFKRNPILGSARGCDVGLELWSCASVLCKQHKSAKMLMGKLWIRQRSLSNEACSFSELRLLIRGLLRVSGFMSVKCRVDVISGAQYGDYGGVQFITENYVMKT